MTKRPATHKAPPAVLDQTTAYARSVVDGTSPAGPFVRDACARHLRDLVDGPARGLRWDVEAAERMLSFCRDVLKLNGGEFEGAPFTPLPWQAFVFGSIFGWKGADGFRRFRIAFVLTGKGSGKSPSAAAVGLYCMVADGEPGAEVYAGAAHRDQAMIMFRDAVAMVRQSPEISKRIKPSGGPGKEWNLFQISTGSFFRVIASDTPQSGARPHCSLLDEIHEHRDSTLLDMLLAGTKGRRQALTFAITNAESDRTGVCAQYRDYSRKVCAGVLIDDSFFAYVAALDEGDDPFTDETCWAKANPSLGHTFGVDYLRRQVTQARGMPSREATVRRLNFCEPTDAISHWIGSDMWDAAQGDFDPADMKGYPCFAALDLSRGRDLTALAMAWKRDGKLYMSTHFWLPGDTIEEKAREDNVPYPVWVAAGHMDSPPGRVIDKRFVAAFVQQMYGEHDLQALAFDQAQMGDFETACEDIGFDAWIDDRKRDDAGEPVDSPGTGLRMVRHGQGRAGYNHSSTLWMPRSIGSLEEGIIKQTIVIRPNPVLTWNSASARLSTDEQGNRTWDKKKATGKIDGMVAASMAVGLANSISIVKKVRHIWERDDLWETPK